MRDCQFATQGNAGDYGDLFSSTLRYTLKAVNLYVIAHGRCQLAVVLRKNDEQGFVILVQIESEDVHHYS